jgi:hypothetical protein
LTPYILLVRKKLPRERPPSPNHVYDDLRQLWIDKKSGMPLVSCMRTHARSQFGETTLTETREGADQTEGAALQVSQFGETIKTMTREGVDQTEGSTIQASQLGETTLTKTQEGADQTERTALQQFDAPYSHF